MRHLIMAPLFLICMAAMPFAGLFRIVTNRKLMPSLVFLNLIFAVTFAALYSVDLGGSAGVGGAVAVLTANIVAPFPVTPELMAIAVGYRNPSFIADEVLPRIRVGVQSFKYHVYPTAESFTIPDTRVGRKSKPNEVEFTASELTDTCEASALDDPIPMEDIDNAPQGYNPVLRAGEELRHLIALGREKRVADLVFAAGTWTHKVALTGNDQWHQYAQTSSDPIDDIMTGLDDCLVRPNIMVIGQAAWTKLRMHPVMIKAITGTASDSGVVSRRQVAELFELEDVYVGQSFLNTAKKGQTASLARVWGKHCLLAYRDRSVTSTQGRITYGFTAEWGSAFGGQAPDANIGAKGGVRVRMGEYLKEKVVAADCAYFLQNVVA